MRPISTRYRETHTQVEQRLKLWGDHIIDLDRVLRTQPQYPPVTSCRAFPTTLQGSVRVPGHDHGRPSTVPLHKPCGSGATGCMRRPEGNAMRFGTDDASGLM